MVSGTENSSMSVYPAKNLQSDLYDALVRYATQHGCKALQELAQRKYKTLSERSGIVKKIQDNLMAMPNRYKLSLQVWENLKWLCWKYKKLEQLQRYTNEDYKRTTFIISDLGVYKTQASTDADCAKILQIFNQFS